MPLELPAWPPDWPEIQRSVASALASGHWAAYRSDLVAALAVRLADQFQVSTCWLTCSGTAAIELALRAARVGPGDEVIMAAYDYPGNFRTIELLGATPVLVDVASGSPCIDAGQLEAAASDKVVAVIASHLYGQAAPIESLRRICDHHDWVLIEDACQVPGMTIDSRPAGSFGDFAALSFGGSKPITAGAGGALLATNQRLAARLPAIVQRPSNAFPLSPLQAAVISPQLDRLDELNRRRLATAEFLWSQLPAIDWLGCPRPAAESQQRVQPAFYKLAWLRRPDTAGSARPNPATGVHSESAGASSSGAPATPTLPIGQGFRSLAAVSPRRCRKPVPLDRSIELGELCLVLDHRALLVDSDQYPSLVDAVQRG